MPAEDAQGETRPPSARGVPAEPKSFSDLLNEFAGMVITYVKQETVDPIRALGRFLGLGLAGALLIAIGWVVLALAVTRLLQAETKPHLEGSLTWVPYMGGLITAALGVAWAVWRISKEQQK
jgi:hypothetical protein